MTPPPLLAARPSRADRTLDSRRWPTRRTCAIGLAASVLFALYGSLVPFDLQPIPLAQAMQTFATLWEQPLVVNSRSDFVANIFLTAPVGFTLMALFRLDRRGVAGTTAALVIALIAGFGVALATEFVQVFTSDRVPSRSDVTAQMLGIAIGVATWVLLGQALADWLRGHVRGRLSAPLRRVQAFVAVYAAAWLLLMLLPLELTFSPAEVLRKYRNGLIVLVPFTGAYDSRADLVWDAIGGVAAAVPLGVLALLTASNRGWRALRSLAVVLGLLFVTGAEMVQVFVAGRVVDVTDALLGGLGLAIGVWLAAPRLPFAAVTTPPRAARPSRSAVAALAGAIVWSAVLAFYHWKPFMFSFDARHVADRLAQVSLLPLQQYEHGSGVQVLGQALVKAGLAFPLGLFLGSWLAHSWRDAPSARMLRFAAGLLIASAVLGGIEIVQILLPARVPDITDVLVGCVGAVGGLKAAPLVADVLEPCATPIK